MTGDRERTGTSAFSASYIFYWSFGAKKRVTGLRRIIVELRYWILDRWR